MAGCHVRVAITLLCLVIPAYICGDPSPMQSSFTCGKQMKEATFTERSFVSPEAHNTTFSCTWIFNATATGFSVALTFHHLNTYGSASLLLYDGYGENKLLPWDHHVTSTREYLTLVLKDWNSHALCRLSYQEVKVNKTWDETKMSTYTTAYITSPGYPVAYLNLIDYFWLIVTNIPHGQITIDVIRSDLSSYNDMVLIFDGPSEYYPLLGKFDKNKTPRFVSSGDRVYVHFHSDETITGSGFSLAYSTAIYEECRTSYIYVGAEKYIEAVWFNQTISPSKVCQWVIAPTTTLNYKSTTIEVLEMQSWPYKDCRYHYLEAQNDNNDIFGTNMCKGDTVVMHGNKHVSIVLRTKYMLDLPVINLVKVVFKVTVEFDIPVTSTPVVETTEGGMNVSVFGVFVGLAPLVCFCLLVLSIMRKRRAAARGNIDATVTYTNPAFMTPFPSGPPPINFVPTPPAYDEVTKNDTTNPPAYETVAMSNPNQAPSINDASVYNINPNQAPLINNACVYNINPNQAPSINNASVYNINPNQAPPINNASVYNINPNQAPSINNTTADNSHLYM